MAGYLALAQLARTANDRMRAARELEARWQALPPDEQEEARAEWVVLKAALRDVSARMTAGPRGFARGFRAGLRGEEAEAPADGRPLTAVVRDLHAASTALKAKLDAVE
ncbi:unannotated protein [freshwater metagenome]|uniref:Unannotated protein n=1 Tax=freshwater metagenome TaxID=449393 RepID=A0A6J7K7M7_9ZZZZ|nr:hypothetical protein [Actinomycetota bacterium]